MTLRDLLDQRYASPEWVLLDQVQNGKGGGRYCDHIAVSLWASRGISIHAFETKVTRADWLRELKQPAKSEAFFDHTDAFWLVSLKGVALKHEVPETWGWLEQRGERLYAAKQPQRRAPKPVSRHFLAALLQRMLETALEPQRKTDAEFEQRVAEEAELQTKSARNYAEAEGRSATTTLAAISKAIGGISLNGWNVAPIAAALGPLYKANLRDLDRNALAVLNHMSIASEALTDLHATIKIMEETRDQDEPQ